MENEWRHYDTWPASSSPTSPKRTFYSNNHSYHQNGMYQEGSGVGDSGGSSAMNALAAAVDSRQ